MGLLLAYLDDTRVRLTFRACAIAFHFGVALLTAIDFFENRVVLFVVAISDDLLGGGASAAACSPWPSRLFAFALLFPVLAGVEHFPFTHNGLFPFSGRQMRAVREVCDRQGTLVATDARSPCRWTSRGRSSASATRSPRSSGTRSSRRSCSPRRARGARPTP